jgi:hypothetical protein
VEELLASASFRETQADSLGRIVQHLEVDAWDLVTAAAKDFTPSNLGRCYWARAALFHLVGRQVGARLQQLLEPREEVEPVAGDTARLLEGAEEFTDLALQFVSPRTMFTLRMSGAEVSELTATRSTAQHSTAQHSTAQLVR